MARFATTTASSRTKCALTVGEPKVAVVFVVVGFYVCAFAGIVVSSKIPKMLTHSADIVFADVGCTCKYDVKRFLTFFSFLNLFCSLNGETESLFESRSSCSIW